MTLSLYAIVLRLAALNSGVVPAHSGQHAHAAFLNLLTSRNPELAGLLHDADERKPFTVSPLLHAPPADHKGMARFQAGDTCALRITLAGLRVFSDVNEASSLAGHTLSLGPEERRVDFRIIEACLSPAQHPLAGATTHDALARSAQPGREITLRFVTPTSFKYDTAAGEKVLSLPLPEYVFGGLAARWMSFCGPHPLDLAGIINHYAAEGWVDTMRPDGQSHDAVSAWRDLLGRHLMVTRMADVNTDVMRISGQKQIGFTGDVTFEVVGDPMLERVATVLADAAFYFGVGRKTTQGMGMTRRLR